MSGFQLIVVLLSGLVLFGAICRLDVMMVEKHKISWGIMYICYAAFAASCALKSYEEGAVFGLLACSLNLILTKHMWEDAPPTSVEKTNA